MTALSSEFLDLQEALAGGYSIERELGRGGMGVVYLARDVRLEVPLHSWSSEGPALCLIDARCTSFALLTTAAQRCS